MPRAAVEVDGLREFRSHLKTLENGPRWTRELGADSRGLAREVAGWVRADAAGGSPQQRHFAGAIAGRGGVSGAKLTIDKAQRGQTYAGAQGAYWGSKAYPQFPRWVGASWPIAAPTGGPYVINRTLWMRSDDIGEHYRALVLKVATSASSYFTETF